MRNYNIKPCSSSRYYGRYLRIFHIQPCPAARHCKSRLQVFPVAAVDSLLQSFTYKVTAKQAITSASKLRLDTFLAAQIAADLAPHQPSSASQTHRDVSRAKVQTAIAAGLVRVNGQPVGRASQQLRPGDYVECCLPPPTPLKALPEPIPLDVKYEDDHIIVVNKPAGMVVHLAPGHHSGTLVNALLAHCVLPAMDLQPDLGLDPGLQGETTSYPNSHSNRNQFNPKGLQAVGRPPESGRATGGTLGSDVIEDDDGDDFDVGGNNGEDEGQGFARGAVHPRSSLRGSSSCSDSLRPGIVHRLDKGTSGLLVVAKTEVALTRLQAQFKARTVDRLYDSITVGCPAAPQSRVETNVERDPRDRKRMAAAPYGSGRGRTASSSYTVLSALAGGGAALVQWKLDTGRTHQIRVHAKHLGHPLLGDETYGGTVAAAVAAARGFPADTIRTAVAALDHPALHARTLGFTHPLSGVRLLFEESPPEDFEEVLRRLRD